MIKRADIFNNLATRVEMRFLQRKKLQVKFKELILIHYLPESIRPHNDLHH